MSEVKKYLLLIKNEIKSFFRSPLFSDRLILKILGVVGIVLFPSWFYFVVSSTIDDLNNSTIEMINISIVRYLLPMFLVLTLSKLFYYYPFFIIPKLYNILPINKNRIILFKILSKILFNKTDMIVILAIIIIFLNTVLLRYGYSVKINFIINVMAINSLINALLFYFKLKLLKRERKRIVLLMFLLVLLIFTSLFFGNILEQFSIYFISSIVYHKFVFTSLFMISATVSIILVYLLYLKSYKKIVDQGSGFKFLKFNFIDLKSRTGITVLLYLEFIKLTRSKFIRKQFYSQIMVLLVMVYINLQSQGLDRVYNHMILATFLSMGIGVLHIYGTNILAWDSSYLNLIMIKPLTEKEYIFSKLIFFNLLLFFLFLPNLLLIWFYSNVTKLLLIYFYLYFSLLCPLFFIFQSFIYNSKKIDIDAIEIKQEYFSQLLFSFLFTFIPVALLLLMVVEIDFTVMKLIIKYDDNFIFFIKISFLCYLIFILFYKTIINLSIKMLINYKYKLLKGTRDAANS